MKICSLICALIISVMFVVGIVMIPVFAGRLELLILGIVFTVVGFYGTPLIWIKFGNDIQVARVVDAVLEEKLLSNREISQYLQKDEKLVKSMITTAIKKKYLTGFLYDGVTLSLNEKKRQIGKKNNKCENCCGLMEELDDAFYCPYCGSKIKK